MSFPMNAPALETNRLVFAQRYGFTYPPVSELKKQLHSQFPSIQNAAYSAVSMYPYSPLGFRLKIPDYEYLVHITNYHFLTREEEEDDVEADEEEEKEKNPNHQSRVDRGAPYNEVIPIDNCRSSVSTFFCNHFALTYNPDFKLIKAKGLYDNTPPKKDDEKDEKEKEEKASSAYGWERRKTRRSENLIRYYNNLFLLKLLAQFHITKMKSFPYWMTFTPDNMPSTAPDPDQKTQFPLLLKQGIIDEKDKNFYYCVQSFHVDKKKKSKDKEKEELNRLLGTPSEDAEVEEPPEVEYVWRLAETFDCMHSIVLKDSQTAWACPHSHFVSLLNQQDVYIASTNGLILNPPRKFHLYGHTFFNELNFMNLYREYRMLLAAGWKEKEKEKDRTEKLLEQERQLTLLFHYASALHSQRWNRRANLPLPMIFFRFFQIFRHISIDIPRLPNEGIDGTSYGDELLDFGNLLMATHGDWAMVEKVWKKYQEYIAIRKRKRELKKWGRARPLDIQPREFNEEEKNIVCYYALFILFYAAINKCSVMTHRQSPSPSTSSTLFSLASRILSFSSVKTIETMGDISPQLASTQQTLEESTVEWIKQPSLGGFCNLVDGANDVNTLQKWWKKAFDGGMVKAKPKEKEKEGENFDEKVSPTATEPPLSTIPPIPRFSSNVSPNAFINTLFTLFNPHHELCEPLQPFTFYAVQNYNSLLHPLRFVPFIQHFFFHSLPYETLPLDFNESAKFVEPLYRRLQKYVEEGKKRKEDAERAEEEKEAESGVIILNQKKKKKLLALEEPKAVDVLKQSKTVEAKISEGKMTVDESEDIEAMYSEEEEKKLQAIETAPADQYKDGGEESDEEDVDDHDGVYTQQLIGQPRIENQDELDHLLYPYRAYLPILTCLFYLSVSGTPSSPSPTASAFIDSLFDELIAFIEKTNQTLPKDEVLSILEALCTLLYGDVWADRKIPLNNPVRSHLIARLVGDKTREAMFALLHLLCLQNIYSFPINFACHRMMLFYFASTPSTSSNLPTIHSASNAVSQPFIFASLVDIFKGIRGKQRDNNNEMVLVIQLQLVEAIVKDGELYKRFRIPFHNFKLVDQLYTTILAAYMRDPEQFFALFRTASRAILISTFATLMSVLRMELNMSSWTILANMRDTLFHLCRRFVARNIRDRDEYEKKGKKEWCLDDYVIYKAMAVCLFFGVIPIGQIERGQNLSDGLYPTREQEEVAKFVLVQNGKEKEKEDKPKEKEKESVAPAAFKPPSFPQPAAVPTVLSSKSSIAKAFVDFVYTHRFNVSFLCTLWKSPTFSSNYTQMGTNIRPPGSSNNPSQSATPTSGIATKKMDFAEAKTTPKTGVKA